MTKLAVVTGASGGIGTAISKSLIEAGINVVLIGRKNEKVLKQLCSYATQNGVKSAYYLIDIANSEEVNKVYKDIVCNYGEVDILINNAGISLYKLFTDCTSEDFDNVVGTNLKGMFNFSKLVSTDMVRVKKGNIINISSVWGSVGSSMEVLYCMSKGGVDSFTKALAKELAPSGVRVNAIAPGVIDTKMNDIFTDEEKRALEQEIAIGKFGTPENIADTVMFLISDKSCYVTGQIITVDGGFI